MSDFFHGRYAPLQREQRKLSAVLKSQLLINRVDMGLDGSFGYFEVRGDLEVVRTNRDVLKDLKLSCGENVQQCRGNRSQRKMTRLHWDGLLLVGCRANQAYELKWTDDPGDAAEGARVHTLLCFPGRGVECENNGFEPRLDQ